MNQQSLPKRRFLWILPVSIFAAIVVGIALLGRSLGFPFLQVNPNYQVAQTSKSLWDHGTLMRSECREIYNLQLEKSRANPGTRYWQDVFSLGKNGQLYPMRGVFMSFVAAPFYGLFGEFGFWLFNQLLLFLVLLSFCRIARTLTSYPTALFMGVVLLAGTEILDYSYTFSYDLFALCLIVCGLDILRAMPFLGAFLIIAAVETRATNLLFLPFLLFAWLPYCSHRRRTLLSIFLGALLGGAVIMTVNQVLWGGPFATGFQRMVVFINGEALVEKSYFSLSVRTFLSDWWVKLFGPSGLLRHNPVLLVFPFAIVAAAGSKFRSFCWFLSGAALSHICLIYSLKTWQDNDNARRYLLGAVILMVLLSAFLAEKLREKERHTAPGK